MRVMFHVPEIGYQVPDQPVSGWGNHRSGRQDPYHGADSIIRSLYHTRILGTIHTTSYHLICIDMYRYTTPLWIPWFCCPLRASASFYFIYGGPILIAEHPQHSETYQTMYISIQK